ncbi:MAG: carboxymuconolactone decarboxylase family protein [Vicingaceae bacterium]
MEQITVNETAAELLTLLGLASNQITDPLNVLGLVDSKYLRDLKMNVKTVLKGEMLSDKEISLLAYGACINEKSDTLAQFFKNRSTEHGASPEELSEVVSCTSLLSSNNVFYRFRHFTGKEEYQQVSARLRMSIMMNPVMGKEFFELISLAISAINGCEACVNSHEESLRALGTDPKRIFEAVRLVSVIISLNKVIP